MSTNTIRSLLQRPDAVIMGIINTTPDSFSDGGQFNSVDSAFQHALRLLDEGADLLDIGGESTRPGASAVSRMEELDRVIPVIERLQAESEAPISIDTRHPEVMREAINAGAGMVNDVNGLRADGALELVAELNTTACIMHMQGQPSGMQDAPRYTNVVEEVVSFLKDRLSKCQELGIAKQDLVVDPGIGFGKSLTHNLALLDAVPEFRRQLDTQVLIGVSRKSMIDKLFGRTTEQRLPASLGLAVQAVLNGAKIVRVHDVRATHDAVRAVERVQNWQNRLSERDSEH